MSVELVHGSRNGQVENIYRGDAVVVNLDDDEVIYELGDRFKKTFWRSSAKPFQVLPLVEAGGIERYNISGEELALMCASHGGEEGHVEAVETLLKKIGFSEPDLHCGPAPPMYRPAVKEILKRKQNWTQLHNCCSGKHSGMLAIAAIKGYATDGYEEINHPLQQEVLEIASEISGVKKEEIGIGVDGCGAPIFYMPLFNMAKAYAYLSKPGSLAGDIRAGALKKVAEAMSAYPWYVAGTGRLDTVLMEVTGGRLLAKLGADGVYCVSFMGEGKGIALKIECGVIKAIEPAIVEILRRLNYIDHREEEVIIKKLDFSIYNHRKESIGSLQAVF